MSGLDEQDLDSVYRRYNRLCNAHRFDRLAEFVAQDVEVNGELQGLQAYVEGLQAVVKAFPDYRWDLQHLFVSGAWVAAHFHDTGTHRGTFHGVPATGRRVSIQEFAIYRFQVGRIAEVWVTADNLRLLDQLR
jgi:steroid delta-isomerase-like uncharacterized protein